MDTNPSVQNWVSDAQMLHKLNDDFLYTNSPIDSFLKSDGNDKFIVISSKGMGKTLLMRYKRKIIEESKTQRGILLIPQNDMCDYIALPPSLPNDVLSSLDDQVFWEDLWSISIISSIITTFPISLSKGEIESLSLEIRDAGLPSSIAKEIDDSIKGKHNSKRPPSYILGVMLDEGKSGIEKSRQYGLKKLWDILFNVVTSSCYVFIDSLDQELHRRYPGNLDIWCAAQCGLLRSAWEISRQIRHIRVFATIRQEAYASFVSPEKSNISGSVLLIEYSNEDLREIFLRAIRAFSSAKSIEEFVGFSKIYNGYLRTREEIFSYICRHTIGVPRWLIQIGENIAKLRKELGEIRGANEITLHQRCVSDCVNRTSSELAENYLCNEMGLFFNGDDMRIFVDTLISKVQSSILSVSSMTRIRDKYVEDYTPNRKHPFCLLYNLGLIGTVEKSASTVKMEQRFRRPYKFDWKFENILPDNPGAIYLLHPCLHDLIQNRNPKFMFYKIKIGNGSPWTKKEQKRLDDDTIRVFISYHHSDTDKVNRISEIVDSRLSDKAMLHDIWIDRQKMRGGQWIQKQIESGLNKSDYLILAISRNSLASNAVNIEWRTVFERKLKLGLDSIFPIIIDDTPFDELPTYLKPVYAYRYSDDAIVARLVDDMLFWKQNPESGG